MFDIRHRVGVNAPIEKVYRSVATREGVASWWTHDVEGESRRGETLAFRFGYPEPWVAMEVADVVPFSLVQWRCVKGPEEWLDTTVRFELKVNEGETTLMFTHAGWREPVEFMHHCTTKWGYFLLGLKSELEDGKATPFPNDAPMSSWG